MELRNRAKRQGQSGVASDRRVKPKLPTSATSCTPCDPGQLRMEEANLNLSLGIGRSGETTESTGEKNQRSPSKKKGKSQRWSTAEIDFLLSQFGKIGWESSKTFCAKVAQLMTVQFNAKFSEGKVDRRVRLTMDSFAKLEQSSSAKMDYTLKKLLQKYSDDIRPVYEMIRGSSSSTQSASTTASSLKKNKEPWTTRTIATYMHDKGGYRTKYKELGEIIIALGDEQLGPAYLMMADLAKSMAETKAVLEQLVVEFKKKKAAADAL